MTLVEAILLGVVQGIAEFLPISSSGHLRLGHALFGNAPSARDLAFDVLLHLGTLVAVLVVYAADLRTATADAWRGLRDPAVSGWRNRLERSEGLRLAMLLFIATVPTACIGLALKDLMESPFFSAPVVCGLLAVNGFVLYSSRRAGPAEGSEKGPMSVAGIGVREALLIGIAQGIAVAPGISRSGMTVVAALLLGAQRMRAAQFSFFLSIPAVVGALVLELDPEALVQGGDHVTPWLAGLGTSAVVGVASILVLLRLLRSAQFHLFAWYSWFVAAAGLALWFGAGGR